MSGGHSLHTKDWLELAALGALGATGLGAAGIGPAAGLFGGTGIAATAPAAAPAELAGGLGAGAADEAVGSAASGAANPFTLGLHNAANAMGLDNMGPSSLLGKLSKAQTAYKLGSGLLGGQPQGGGGGGAPPSAAFGQRASPVNLTQFTQQPNSMMPQQPQLPPQLAMLPPNDPRVLAYLQQMGGMYG